MNAHTSIPSAPTVADAKCIAAIGARLQSDNDDERAAAGLALVKALAKHGLRIGDVLERALVPERRATLRQHKHDLRSGHEAIVRECLAGTLTDWERAFLIDIRGNAAVSRKQAGVLCNILGKVRRQPATGGVA